jgi:hypothetical protein
MNRQKTPTSHMILGFIIVLLLIGLVGLFLWLVWQQISSGSTEVNVAIFSGSLTIVSSVIIVVLSRRFERQKAIEEEQRTKKIPVYSEFLDFWIKRVLLSAKHKKTITQKEMEQFLGDFTQKLMLWGSDEVVKEYVGLRRRSGTTTSREDAKQFLFDFEGIIYLIRSDLGHKNKDLEQGDLLRLFLTEDLNDAAKSLTDQEES